MSPDDIDEVTVRWNLAASEPQLLHLAIAERLTGSIRFRNRRADWIIETVTCLSEVLEHPGTFASRAADLLSQRPFVTTDELANERDALLAALTDLCGPLEGAALRSWTLAIGLFAEFVAATGLHPFSHNDQEDEPQATRLDPLVGLPPRPTRARRA
jgi:hypothetical protein